MNGLETHSFLYIYETEIAPKLREIDLALRTARGSLGKAEVCRLLDITACELDDIMGRHNIKRIDKAAFFKIMLDGESSICGLYRREVECGAPYTYERQKIAYIYGLNPDDVNNACDRLGIIEATAFTLPVLFSQIPV